MSKYENMCHFELQNNRQELATKWFKLIIYFQLLAGYIGNIIGMDILLIVNKIYFKKREHLCVN